MDLEELDIIGIVEDVGFKQIINKIVDEEVKIRLGNKLSEIGRLKKFESDYYKVSRELRSTEVKHEKELQAAIKEAKDEVKRSIFGGYKLGDTVYYVIDCSERIPCSTCGGSGKVSANFGDRALKASCPDCSYGKIRIKNYKPIKASISDITHKEWAQERCSKTSFWIQPVRGDSIERDLEGLFKTEEECQKKCDELNAKEA